MVLTINTIQEAKFAKGSAKQETKPYMPACL